MIKIALAHNHFDLNYLSAVMAEMLKLGSPTIRIVHVERDLYQAIEGCHRLRASAALGLTPVFEVIDHDTLRTDVPGLDFEDGSDERAIVGSIGDWENVTLVFED